MYPELFSIGKFTIYTYGVLVALGFFIGMQYIVRYSKNIISKQQIYDFLFYVILVGIIGARIFYVFLDMSYYLSHPLEIIQVWKGGLVYYGGFAAVLIFAFFYCKYKKFNIVKLVDIFAPALALGHFFGRIGCFFSGCCYGKNTDCFLAIAHKHPTQLYEALGNLIIFFILNKFLQQKHKDGYVFVLYMLLYSILRFGVEFFRGDDRGIFFFGLSPAQNISIIIFMIAMTLIFNMYRNK
ncbi:MAG: prolipoprotein diacylglyceryl transferase [Elusimicrobia bacterium]|nr:prolipoprotein diacylglyceryl transferase [Elusimicrobiota bacterium]